jgi:uncharacterized membrane protein
MFLGRISENLLAGLAILLYTVVFSSVMILKFYALRTYAYDLGNYNQALYTTLHGHGLLYYVADLPVTGGSMMGVHFSPILLMILPIYAIYPAPPTLLVLKTFVLALGAYPLYRLAKYCLKASQWGLLFSVAYLFNPVLQGINWFDFHPEDFFPTFCLFSLYYGIKGDWAKYLLFVVLALTTTEHSAILVLVNSLYLLWINRSKIKSSLQAVRYFELRKMDAAVKYPTSTAILAVSWFFVAIEVILLFSPNPLVKGGASQWSVLGANGIFDIPLKVLTSPQNALSALAYDWPLKLVYLLILFGSTAFLSFASPKSLILTLPWLSVSLLSNYSPFYYLGNQYSAFLLPSVMVGAVMGTRELLERTSEKRRVFKIQRAAPILLLISTLVFFVASTPLYSLHLGEWPDLTYGIPTVTEHDRLVSQFASLIRPNESVITQQSIFPLVSSRSNSFVIPLGSFYPPGTDFNTTLNQWIQQADFILVDSKTSLFETYLVFAYMRDFGIQDHFGVYASEDGIALLKRSYSAEPVLFAPYTARLDWTNLTLINGKVVMDVNSSSEKALLHGAQKGSASDFCRSSLLQLQPGNYDAFFRLKIANCSSDFSVTIGLVESPLELDVYRNGTESSGYRFYFTLRYADFNVTRVSKELIRSDFSKPDTYEEFKLTFTLDVPSVLTVIATEVSSCTDLYLDWIDLAQTHALP